MIVSGVSGWSFHCFRVGENNWFGVFSVSLRRASLPTRHLRCEDVVDGNVHVFLLVYLFRRLCFGSLEDLGRFVIVAQGHFASQLHGVARNFRRVGCEGGHLLDLHYLVASNCRFPKGGEARTVVGACRTFSLRMYRPVLCEVRADFTPVNGVVARDGVVHFAGVFPMDLLTRQGGWCGVREEVGDMGDLCNARRREFTPCERGLFKGVPSRARPFTSYGCGSVPIRSTVVVPYFGSIAFSTPACFSTVTGRGTVTTPNPLPMVGLPSFSAGTTMCSTPSECFSGPK